MARCPIYTPKKSGCHPANTLIRAPSGPPPIPRVRKRFILAIPVRSYPRRILATSGAAAGFMGTRVHQRLPVFTQYLPRQEHATYQGAGVLGEHQLVGFRVSGTKPLVVIVEEASRSVVQRWLAESRALLGIGVALVLLVLGLTFAVWRGVRTRQMGRQ